jgi:hypothetical protein
MALLTVLQ